MKITKAVHNGETQATKQELIALAKELAENVEIVFPRLDKKNSKEIPKIILSRLVDLDTDTLALSDAAKDTLSSIYRENRRQLKQAQDGELPTDIDDSNNQLTPPAPAELPAESTAQPDSETETADQADQEPEAAEDVPEPLPESEWTVNYLTSRESLNCAALDMSEVMGFEPGIDITADEDHFMKLFYRAANEFAEGRDNFREHTWAVFAAMDCGPVRQRMTPKYAKIPKPKKQSKVVKEPAAVEVAPEVVKSAPKEKKATAAKIPRSINALQVVADYVKSLNGAEFTHQQVFEHASKICTEKTSESMMHVVKGYVPNALTKKKGFTFVRLGAGKYKATGQPE